MAIPSRQIGWGTTDNLLWQISKQIEAVTGIAANSTGSGTSGTSGVTGLSGTSGTSGIVGTSGTSGVSGTAGITGTAGTSGTSSTLPTSLNYGLFAQTASSTPITGTIVETSLITSGVGTLTVPANTFNVGDSFHAKLIGHISCVGTAILEIRVKSGSILLADTGSIALDTSTNKHWEIDVYFTVRSLGAATVASIASGGLFSYIKNSGTNFEGTDFSIINNTTFDTTISNTLDITAQWNSTNAGNSIYSEIFTLNKTY